MDSTGEWPLAIIATQDVSCGARLWSVGTSRRATVIVKATLGLVRGGAMRVAAPAPILLGDQHHEASIDRSVAASADVSPYLPRAEVLLTGHAYAPSPSPFMPVRLSVVGARPLVDKTLHVFGERMWLETEQTTAPVPFTRIPIRYERAARGPVEFEENPVGLPAQPGLPVFNVVDPSDRASPAGFGPIAPHWPARRRLLRGLDPATIDAPRPTIPDTFAWSFFHAAPPDQRCTFFEGTEWVVLEGMHPDHARIESQLPGARAQARVYGVDSTGHREVNLVADTLWLDPDHSIACVVWRGNFEVESDAALQSAQVFAGLELPGRPIPWPGATAAVAADLEKPGPTNVAPDDTGDRSSEVPTRAQVTVARVGPAIAETAGVFTEAAPPEPAPPPPADTPARPADVTAASPTPTSARAWVPGSTLASPVMLEQLMAADAERQAAAAPPIAIQDAPRPPESITNVRLNLETLQQPPPAPGSAPQAPTSTGTLSSTIPQAPSELRALIAKAAQDNAPPTEAHGAPTDAASGFEDAPTYAPEASDVARIVQEAEASALQSAPKPDPLGVRPQPPALARSAKTTIRGLGDSDSKPPPEPPSTARAGFQQMKSLIQAEEQPTAQLAVPEVLLKLAAEVGLSGVATSEATPGPGRSGDDDDTGRPTLTNAEAPTFSQIAARPAPVHFGEMRLEVERRIRERESLEGLDLSDVDLSGFDLSGQRLTGARFDRAILQKTRFRGVDLSGASLEGADATEADFDDAILERTNLVGAKLGKATLRRAFLTDANLTGAKAVGACLDQASGLRAIFARAILNEASFVGTTLDGADLTEAQLDGANLEGALLPELRAYEVSAEGARFSRCTLRGARFDGGVLGRARFDAAQADDTIWDRAVLDGATFEGARLVGGSFTKASLKHTSFAGADLEDARFNRAVLTGARLTGVDLSKVTLDGAEMSGVITE